MGTGAPHSLRLIRRIDSKKKKKKRTRGLWHGIPGALVGYDYEKESIYGQSIRHEDGRRVGAYGIQESYIEIPPFQVSSEIDP